MAVQTIYAAGMGPNPGDSIPVALVKIVAQLADLTSAMAVQQIYPVMTGNPGDSTQVSLVKVVAHLAAYVAAGGGGGGSGLTFSTGSGSPEGSVSGSPGDTYWDTAANTYYVKVTGSATNTGWAIH
jgi:hypothetical protein